MINSHVTLLFTSDEHGFVTAQSKLQGQVRQARQDNPQGTLLVSSGDVFEGSAENGVLGMESSRKMLQAAGYDVMTVGNHDFDHGAEVARQWVKDAPAKVLLSNVKDVRTGGLLANAEASRVFELDGVKVGLIGATTTETLSFLPADKLEGLSFEDPQAAVQAEVARLKAQGVELIGLVSHLGLPADHKIARAVPELDFILGGHTHAALEKPELEGQTLIVHPGSFRKSMGRLDLTVDRQSGQIQDYDYKLLRGTREDQGEVGRLAHGYGDRVEQAMGQKIGRLPNSLPYNPSQLGEAMESLVDDSVRGKAAADMVLVNQKVIRTGLKQGDVTMRDIFNAFPFDNRFVKIEMPVAQVAKVLQDSLDRLDQTSLTVGGPITVACDIKTRRLNVIEEVPLDFMGPLDMAVQPGPHSQTVPVRVPESHPMSIVTTDYLIQGGLGYFPPGQPIQQDLGLIRDNVRDYVGAKFPAR
jgi:2',3'-cyclic-nucleotide 2'-phosphodiesterase (5'-nucleotidase family)